MSGQKEVVARLSAEAQSQLEADLAQCRENAAELAATANLAGRAGVVAAAAKEWLASGQGSEGFRAKLQAMVAAADELNQARAEIKAMLDKAGGSRGRTATAEDAARVADVRHQTTSRLRALRGLRGRVSDLMDDVEAGLAAEQRAIAGTDIIEGNRRRAEVAGMLEEVETRMHPAAGASFAGVKGEASALKKRLSELKKRNEAPTQNEVAEARGDLAALAQKAEEQERQSHNQWSIYQRLDRTFRAANFRQAGEVKIPAAGEAVLSTHATREAQVIASIESRVEANGSVHIVMRGKEESSSSCPIVLPPDEACPDRLNQIAYLARQQGLVIEKVLYKGPDGYHEMSLPSLAAATTGARAKESERAMEAKSE